MAVAALAELVIPKNARAASAIIPSFFMKTSLSFSFPLSLNLNRSKISYLPHLEHPGR